MHEHVGYISVFIQGLITLFWMPHVLNMRTGLIFATPMYYISPFDSTSMSIFLNFWSLYVWLSFGLGGSDGD